MLLPELNNEFHLSIIDGVERALREDNISVLVSSAGHLGEGSDDPVELMLSKMVDGIITVPPPELATSLRATAQRGVPIVQLDMVLEGTSTDVVVLNNRAAAGMAARHLMDHGHRAIGLLGGLDTFSALRDRRRGFTQALVDRGVPVDDRYVTATSLSVEDGYHAMKRILSLPDRPTGMIASAYEFTVGALIALNESGLRVPQDISFIGFDSRELARVSKPPLTMVLQPINDIASAAAQLMRQRLEGTSDAPPTLVELSAELIVGSSVASLHE